MENAVGDTPLVVARKDEARVPTTRKATSNTVETFPTNEISCRDPVSTRFDVMTGLANDALRSTVSPRDHRPTQGTHGENTAEVTLEAVPVISIVHS